MATVRGERVESVEYVGPATSLRDVWVAVRASLRRVLESTTLEDLVHGDLPPGVVDLTHDAEAYVSLNRQRRTRPDQAGS
jgi:DNA-binding IscR family transcriptional regulator